MGNSSTSQLTANDNSTSPPAVGPVPPLPERRLVGWAVAFLVAAAACLPVDCAVARWCVRGGSPKYVRDVLEAAETFGNGVGVVFILATIWVLAPERRPAVPRLAALSVGSAAIANVLKLLVARTRPYRFDFHGGVSQTFAGWLPLLSGGSAAQSFPSAHTATAAGLALALGWLYPRGGWLFATFAALVACQRVECGAHFPSDTLVGAAAAFLVAAACFHRRGLGGWFEQLERGRTKGKLIRSPAGGGRHQSPSSAQLKGTGRSSRAA